MPPLTKDTLAAMTPDQALQKLKDGNQRFFQNQNVPSDYLSQVKQTSDGQYPFAVVLGCIDSRVPPEVIFDLGIGDIFSIRIAGNFANSDIIGSMEFAAKVVGSKLILVLGHTSCGAIQGAYQDVELGNLTGLLDQLKPAVQSIEKTLTSVEEIDLNQIAQKNVEMTIDAILSGSPILQDLAKSKQIAISGAMYDVSSGKVTFL